MARTASLTSGLVAKKGEAKPATGVNSKASTDRETSVDYYKALTVKLDRQRYESLKTAGVKLDKKSQEIFVEALDLWMKHSAGRQA